MNKFFCKLTGGHKYAASNLKLERLTDSRNMLARNQCTKCAAVDVFVIDINHLIKEDIADFKRRSVFIK